MSERMLPPDEREPGSPEPPDDDVLAAEFVLGVLNETERRAAQLRRQADPAFAARIAAWERRLAPWLSDIAPAHVPEELWPRLCRGLGWRDTAATPSLWSSLALWRSVAALATVAALAIWLTRPPAHLASTAAVPRAPEAVAAPITTLSHADGTPGWLASVDRTRGTVLMVPVPAPPDVQGRVPELWIIPAGQAPRSLGAVSTNKTRTLEVPRDSRASLSAPGSVLAITR